VCVCLCVVCVWCVCGVCVVNVWYFVFAMNSIGFTHAQT